MSDSLLIVGSVAYDSVETPTGARMDELGGSATFAAAAASLFTPVDLVGVGATSCRRSGFMTAGPILTVWKYARL